MTISQHHALPTAVASGPPATPTVTLLAAEACHLCEDAHTELLDRVARGQVILDLVSLDSPQGQALVAHHRPALFPLVLIDGHLFSAGRLPRRKLDRLLAAPKAR